MVNFEGGIYSLDISPERRHAIQVQNMGIILPAGKAIINGLRKGKTTKAHLPDLECFDADSNQVQRTKNYYLQLAIDESASIVYLMHPVGFLVAQTQISHDIEHERLRAKIRFGTTSNYEGHGFGTALAFLSEDLIRRSIKLNDFAKKMKVIYLYLEDWSEGRLMGVKRTQNGVGWSAQIARELGFSDDSDLLGSYGEPSHAASAYIKVLQDLGRGKKL